MDIDWSIFDQFLPEPKPEQPDDCQHDNQIIDGTYTCINCGIVSGYVFSDIYAPPKMYHIYHRINYFREKLRLLTGQKQSTSVKYQNMLNHLKTIKFDSVFELRKLLKLHNYNNFYKYIYNIYFDIKGTRLIKLTNSQTDLMVTKFLPIEREFKKIYKNKSNLLSYNIILYCLLKHYGHSCHQYVVLPKNSTKLTKKVLDLLVVIESY